MWALPGTYWGLSLVQLVWRSLKRTGRDLHVAGRSPKEVCVFAGKEGHLPSPKSMSGDYGGRIPGSCTPVGRSRFSADPPSSVLYFVLFHAPDLLCSASCRVGCSAGPPACKLVHLLTGCQCRPPGCPLPLPFASEPATLS